MRKDPKEIFESRDPNRVLLLRLSSLGDVILASSALSGVASGTAVDWVIGSEFEGLLRGHPRVGRVIGFNRKQGIRGWIRLCRELWLSGYPEIYDLHRNLRTQLARVLFAWWNLTSGSRSRARWQVIGKSRWRRWGYFVFKAAWPARFRPEPWVQRFSRQIGGNSHHRPDFSHLALAEGAQAGDALGLQPNQYLCLVPSTRWPAKEWPPARYAELVRTFHRGGSPLVPVILGMPSDRGAVDVVAELARDSLPHVDALGKLPWPALARVLRDSAGVVGGDTGLMHLAEALGARTVVLFGPTVPEMGFGPWREESRALGADLWCRPCGRDGRYCYRPIKRFHCLRGFPVAPVVDGIRERMSHES